MFLAASFALAAWMVWKQVSQADDMAALQNGVPTIALPAIFDPEFVRAERAKIALDAFVFGYAHGGVAHAYALNLLDGHEIVNDTVGGKPIAATWCTLCNSAVVYDPVVNGRRLTFGVSSKILKNAQVMFDRETGSLWTHATGIAISGAYKGTHLTPLPGATPRIRWAVWQRIYPQTLVLTINEEEDTTYDRYADYRTDAHRVGLYPPSRIDPRLMPKEMVLGICLKNACRAYPFARLQRMPLIADALGGRKILVYRDQRSGATAVFAAPPGDCVLRGEEIVTRSGLRWRAATGTAIRADSPLPPLPYLTAYWFAWSGYHPSTTICEEKGDVKTVP